MRRLSDNLSMSSHAYVESSMSLDPLVVNPGRLSILLALSGDQSGVEFVDLRRRTRMTDGNLASHARRLADGGLIDIAKEFRDGKPVTTYLLTDVGRTSLTNHVEGLVSVVRVAPLTGGSRPFKPVIPTEAHEPVRVAAYDPPAPVAVMAAVAVEEDEDDDWVD